MLNNMSTAPSAKVDGVYDDDRPILQVRAMDPDVAAAMRVECAVENTTLGQLVKAMWTAYEERKYQGKLPTAHKRAQKAARAS
jgi:hypothetical protein